MKIDPKEFRIDARAKVNLGKWPTRVEPFYASAKDYRRRLDDDVEELSGLQRRLYASGSHAVLLVFQAMDAAGKDGAISHVLTGINPEGCEVTSFKQPSAEETAHDFLWRTTCRLPARGRIGVFNRSYYEEVLVVRVHPEFLAHEGGGGGPRAWRKLWGERFESIVGMERHLHRNGTRVVKFFLHLSKGEQRRRFLERIDDPEKNWKFSMADIEERGFWRQYREAYENCLGATSTRHAPWHVVPADDKLNARLIVSRIVIGALRDLRLDFPKGGLSRAALAGIRRRLKK